MQAFESLTPRGQLQRLGHMASTALLEYELPKPRLAPLQHEHNTTFRVWNADGERYVLRIHRPGQHTQPAVRSELLWLVALRQDNVLDVPQPVPNKAGDLLTVVQTEGVPEARICVLFRWLPGRFINAGLTPAHLERVGTFTAHLHRHAAQWQPPRDFVRGRVDNLTAESRHDSLLNPDTWPLLNRTQHPSDEDAERALQLVTDLCSRADGTVVERAIDQIRLVQNELGYDPGVFGLIHADLHQENYFFHRGRVCVIDFDDCGYGHYLFDLNVTLLEVQYHAHYAALRAALLAAYRRVRSLPAAHESHLDTFFVLRHLQLLVWVLQSREHPTFRARWRPWAQEELQLLKRALKDE